MTEVSERIAELRRELAANQASRQFYQLGELLRRDGEAEEAIKILRAGLRHHPRYVAACVSLGRACLDVNDGEGAARALKEALGLDSQNPVAWRLLGEARLSTGDRRGALEAMEHAMVMAPGDEVLRSAVEELKAQAQAEMLAQEEAAAPPPVAAARPLGVDPFTMKFTVPQTDAGDVFGAAPEAAALEDAAPPPALAPALAPPPVAAAPEAAPEDLDVTAKLRVVPPTGEPAAPSADAAPPEVAEVPLVHARAEDVIEAEFLDEPPEPEALEAAAAAEPAEVLEAEAPEEEAAETPEAEAPALEAARAGEAEVPAEDVAAPEDEPVAPEAEARSVSEAAADEAPEPPASPAVRPTLTLARLYIEQQDLVTAASVLEQVLEAESDNQEAADLLELVRDMMGPLPEAPPQLSAKERKIAELQRWAASLGLGRERLQR